MDKRTRQKAPQRQRFEMSQDDFDELKASLGPATTIAMQAGPLASPQGDANRAWQRLGAKLGFHYMSVESDAGGDRFFTAFPMKESN